MKQVTINLYEFSELSPKAKEKAKSQFYDRCNPWGYEIYESMGEARKIYDKFNCPKETVSGIRLYKFIQNHILPCLRHYKLYYKDNGTTCSYYASKKTDSNSRFSKIDFDEYGYNLTGYCADYDFLKPIFDFLKNPTARKNSEDFYNTDLEMILNRVNESEIEAFFEDSNFAEHCEANGYFFTEYGELA